MILKSPCFALVAVISLALGIGANTAIFSLVDTVLLKTLPVKYPRELYVVARNPERPSTNWNYPDYVASGIMVSGNYFQVLGVGAALGRVLNPEDDRRLGAGPHLVLSRHFWRRRFAADPRIVWTTVRLNGYPSRSSGFPEMVSRTSRSRSCPISSFLSPCGPRSPTTPTGTTGTTGGSAYSAVSLPEPPYPSSRPDSTRSQSSRRHRTAALRQETGSRGARSGFRLRKSLVVLQVALSLLLLIGAGLFVRSLQNLRTLDAGFRKEHLLFVNVDPNRSGYKGQRLRDSYERLRERVEALPGVRTATLASITPLGGSRWNDFVSIPGWAQKPGEWNVVDQNAVSPRFFETAGIPIVLDRDFRAEDNPAFSPTPSKVVRAGTPPSTDEEAGPRVAIVNESMAKKYFLNQNPIGMRVSFGDTYRAERSFEIVGVVKDARYFGLRENPHPMIYQAVWRRGATGSRTLAIRTTSDPDAIVEAVRREVRALDSAVPVLNARTIEQQMDGVCAAFAVTRSAAAFLYGVPARDATVAAGATLTLAAIALLASDLPARGASRLDPNTALRYE